MLCVFIDIRKRTLLNTLRVLIYVYHLNITKFFVEIVLISISFPTLCRAGVNLPLQILSSLVV